MMTVLHDFFVSDPPIASLTFFLFFLFFLPLALFQLLPSSFFPTLEVTFLVRGDLSMRTTTTPTQTERVCGDGRQKTTAAGTWGVWGKPHPPFFGEQSPSAGRSVVDGKISALLRGRYSSAISSNNSFRYLFLFLLFLVCLWVGDSGVRGFCVGRFFLVSLDPAMG